MGVKCEGEKTVRVILGGETDSPKTVIFKSDVLSPNVVLFRAFEQSVIHETSSIGGNSNLATNSRRQIELLKGEFSGVDSLTLQADEQYRSQRVKI